MLRILALIALKVNALQFVLNTNEPWCMEIVPKSYTQGMTVSYTSTGMSED